ncbi:alginate O-acetyltransferase AlgX-related protein [Novipirellula artificiosorum]|uniref:AlgX/AlgJ SGNH hydrolase-like domain-containing protein n=1 Tax=Novipirellula artificiosorum TaxID=2528016 RepID=A0A5C6D8G9_9BACT|nr:hypothetical protein [Novipirellula artificiosorum]TWU31997.1 hypothetical protein Poly41_58850 [Novipirellula artificiosorum]
MPPWNLFQPGQAFLRRVIGPAAVAPVARQDENAPAKVLEGKAGWLFLDNDTNNSVDQHRGTLRLSNRDLRSWRKYARGLKRLGRTVDSPVALLLSPTKESVVGRYHPVATGQWGPMQQIAALIPKKIFVYPVAPLSALGDNAYFVTDTHWTDRGAMLATVELAETLGLSRRDVVILFAKDRYRPQKIVGDLGCKVTPQRSSIAEMLDSYNYGEFLVYDNGLRNFGRILITRQPDAMVDKTCLLFGASSSYSMLNFTSRLFSRVIFVHTAANLDPDFISAVKPNFLIAQTNARYVVRVPKLNYCVHDHILMVIGNLSTQDRKAALENQILIDEDCLAQSGLTAYHQLVIDAIGRHENVCGSPGIKVAIEFEQPRISP